MGLACHPSETPPSKKDICDALALSSVTGGKESREILYVHMSLSTKCANLLGSHAKIILLLRNNEFNLLLKEQT